MSCIAVKTYVLSVADYSNQSVSEISWEIKKHVNEHKRNGEDTLPNVVPLRKQTNPVTNYNTSLEHT